ncbi:MAG: TrmH family RNA methyltransferase, partial [Actinomycetota bacterium]|nr:TrmH family RNA methyltransferase [Actinomycetota bacterium]
ILATDSQGKLDVDEVEVGDRMTLILGSEAQGLAETIRARTDATIRVPMGPFVESLNVAVAAGIVMYRMQRKGQDE